jgi:hypothetical protein
LLLILMNASLAEHAKFSVQAVPLKLSNDITRKSMHAWDVE